MADDDWLGGFSIGSAQRLRHVATRFKFHFSLCFVVINGFAVLHLRNSIWNLPSPVAITFEWSLVNANRGGMWQVV